MNTKKRLFIVLVMTLLVVLLCGCAPKKAPPAPAPAPTPAPAPAPPPRAKVDLLFLTGPSGTTNWSLATGIADMLAKYNHPWLRFTVMEMKGIIFDAPKYLQKDPSKKKTTFVFEMDTYLPIIERGEAPMEAPYTTLRVVAVINYTWRGITALDAKIQTPDDLIGKKISLTPKGMIATSWEAVFKAWGLWGKFEPLYLTMEAGPQALIDGTIQACCIGVAGGGPWFNYSHDQELVARKGFHFISIPEDVIRKAGEIANIPINYVVLPAGGLGRDNPAKDVGGHMGYGTYMTDEQMDPEIVYELVKFMSQHIDEFKLYHAEGAAMSLPRMAKLPVPESKFHPGAVKFYKEKGIKVGK